MGNFDRFALVRSCRRGDLGGEVGGSPPGSAAILAACGLEARTPGTLSQTGTAQGSGGPPSHVMCITPQGGENRPSFLRKNVTPYLIRGRHPGSQPPRPLDAGSKPAPDMIRGPA